MILHKETAKNFQNFLLAEDKKKQNQDTALSVSLLAHREQEGTERVYGITYLLEIF